MLSTTFLGHQGWLFQSKAASFLVDPLLCEEFGQAQALEYRVYPPRVFTFESLSQDRWCCPDPRARRSLRHSLTRSD